MHSFPFFIEINLDKVPCREETMSPYEIMLSESQERMLLILNNGKEESAKKIFKKWGLNFSIIGKTTNSNHLDLNFKGSQVAHIPLSSLSKKDVIALGGISLKNKKILNMINLRGFAGISYFK